MCNNTHQLVIMITDICTNGSSRYNLTPKSTYACIPPVFHLFLSVVTFHWCLSLNVNFIHFTKNIVTHSQHEFFINLDIIHKIRHLCTSGYNTDSVTITEDSPVTEIYMIMQVKNFHGFMYGSSRGGNKQNLKKKSWFQQI